MRSVILQPFYVLGTAALGMGKVCYVQVLAHEEHGNNPCEMKLKKKKNSLYL
jgi:hypothetical protein